MTQIEIYVVKTEIIGNKAANGLLKTLKNEITEKLGGITELSTKRGAWIENGVEIEDKTEIWRFCVDNTKAIDFQWLKKQIRYIKAVTNQRSQLWTCNPRIGVYFE